MKNRRLWEFSLENLEKVLDKALVEEEKNEWMGKIKDAFKTQKVEVDQHFNMDDLEQVLEKAVTEEVKDKWIYEIEGIILSKDVAVEQRDECFKILNKLCELNEVYQYDTENATKEELENLMDEISSQINEFECKYDSIRLRYK